MRPEARENGNRLFMNCDFFKEKALLPPEEAELSNEERERLIDHKGECINCNRWLLDKYRRLDVPPEMRVNASIVVVEITRRLTRLLRKRMRDSSASTRRV